MNLVIAVAIGGAIGAVGRYLVSSFVIQQMGTQFPWSTLTVNIVGSLLMGILAEAMKLMWSPTPEIKTMLIVGILGAFTTFSAFSLDVVGVFDRGEFVSLISYVLLSFISCVFALVFGVFVVRVVFS